MISAIFISKVISLEDEDGVKKSKNYLTIRAIFS